MAPAAFRPLPQHGFVYARLRPIAPGADADTVGVIYDFTDGLNFYNEYGMPRELFADAAPASGKRYADVLRGYPPGGDNRPAAVSPSGRRLSPDGRCGVP